MLKDLIGLKIRSQNIVKDFYLLLFVCTNAPLKKESQNIDSCMKRIILQCWKDAFIQQITTRGQELHVRGCQIISRMGFLTFLKSSSNNMRRDFHYLTAHKERSGFVLSDPSQNRTAGTSDATYGGIKTLLFVGCERHLTKIQKLLHWKRGGGKFGVIVNVLSYSQAAPQEP